MKKENRRTLGVSSGLFDFGVTLPYHYRMILITEQAARHLRELALERGSPGLRLAVEKGGCAGLQYEMSLGGPQTGDEIAERDGAVVAIAPDSIAHLEGCTIDYTDGLTGSGFRVINPRAARSCGCGTSFEPAGKQAV
jgi:iron-sulfur cluster assembly accessory protein